MASKHNSELPAEVSRGAEGVALRHSSSVSDGTVDRVHSRRPQGPWGQLLSDLNRLYRRHLSRRALSDAQVGMKTRRERRAVLERALKDLHRRGFELRKLKNLGAKHVQAIIAEWRARGLESSTLSTNFSHLRCLCRWVDKPELLQVIREINEAEPSLTRRRVATDRDRSEQGAGIDRAEILRAALQIDARFCCILALMGEFSLRMLEALLFRPHLAEDPPGCIHILWGTKGGRPRTLPLPLSPSQRAVLAWAKTFAKTSADSMVPQTWRVERYRRRVYRLCARVGLTKKKRGITSHSLRHGSLLRLYELLTAECAPARGGDLVSRDPEADLAARMLVALQAGHSRTSVTSAYLGPRRVTRSKPEDKPEEETDQDPNGEPKQEPGREPTCPDKLSR